MNNFINANNLFRKYFAWLKWENLEQAEFVLWLEQNNYTFSAIPLSTFTPWNKQKIINIITGVRAGVPDMIILLKRGSILFIEMKNKKYQIIKKNWELWKVRTRNDLSKEQIEWKNQLNTIKNVACEVSFWSQQAVNLVKHYERIV